MKVKYNVYKKDDKLKEVISGLRRVRFRATPEHKEFINGAIWLLICLRRSAIFKGLQVIFYEKHFKIKKPFKLKKFTSKDIDQAKSEI